MHNSLTDLAEKYGSDKGVAVGDQHGYSQIYDMLFQHRSHEALKLLEIGLQIGGPEHLKSADRATTKVPSISMWLDYFPHAQIYGVDISEFSQFQTDRFQFFRADSGSLEALGHVRQSVSDIDIIIDDASHASAHQQAALFSLFSALKEGGLFIIEDLQWQPAHTEEEFSGPKTRDFIREYQETGTFPATPIGDDVGWKQIADNIDLCLILDDGYLRAGIEKMAILRKASRAGVRNKPWRLTKSSRLAHSKGDLATALRYAQEAVKYENASVGAYQNLLQIAEKVQSREEFLASAEQAYRLFPEDLKIGMQLVNSFWADKNHKDTLRIAAPLLKHPDITPHAFSVACTSAIELRDFSKAQEIAQIGIEKFPDHAAMFWINGFVELRQSNLSNALYFAKTATQIEPQHQGYLSFLAGVEIAAGMDKFAHETLDKLLELNPAHAGALKMKESLTPTETG